MQRRVIRLAIVERGWRILLMYTLGVGLLFVGARWLQRARFDATTRDMIAIPAVVAVFSLWNFLGSVRLELSATEVRVRKSGLLGSAECVPYDRIHHVEVVDRGMEFWMKLFQHDGTVLEVGPMEVLLAPLYRRRLEVARTAIELGIERATK